MLEFAQTPALAAMMQAYRREIQECPAEKRRAGGRRKAPMIIYIFIDLSSAICLLIYLSIY